MITLKKFLVLASSSALAVPVLADQYYDGRPDDPNFLSESSWATFSGTVTEAEQNAFTLDYSNGEISVTLNDLEQNQDAYAFKEGHEVTVTGKIDKTFFDNSILNASTVYIEALNTTLFSDAMDAQDRIALKDSNYADLQNDTVTFIGWVTQTNELMDTVTVDVGDELVEIHLDNLGYDPFAEDGLINIDEGSRVKVTTSIQDAIHKDYTFDAINLVVL